MRHLVLTAILKNNPIPMAYRLNYVANFYVGPLIKRMEDKHKMTRPEWIVLFCLNQQTGLNAQQISNVTGRPKTSISTAVRQLQKKKLIVRHTDVKDGRRQVLRVTDAGQKIYKAILQVRRARERHDRVPRPRGAERPDGDPRQDDRQQRELGQALLAHSAGSLGRA